GWEFYPYRLPEDLEATAASVEQRTGGDLNQLSVIVRQGKHHRVDLLYVVPASTDDQAARHTAFVATEGLLGEEWLDKWVGAIRVCSNQDEQSQFREGDEVRSAIPLHRLRDTVASLIDRTRDQMPPGPHLNWVGQTAWTMWELAPQAADDYPD